MRRENEHQVDQIVSGVGGACAILWGKNGIETDQAQPWVSILVLIAVWKVRLQGRAGSGQPVLLWTCSSVLTCSSAEARVLLHLWLNGGAHREGGRAPEAGSQ